MWGKSVYNGIANLEMEANITFDCTYNIIPDPWQYEFGQFVLGSAASHYLKALDTLALSCHTDHLINDLAQW